MTILELDSYQFLLLFTTETTTNMIETSTNTPTTVANAAPDSNPNIDIALASTSSKKLLRALIISHYENNWIILAELQINIESLITT